MLTVSPQPPILLQPGTALQMFLEEAMPLLVRQNKFFLQFSSPKNYFFLMLVLSFQCTVHAAWDAVGVPTLNPRSASVQLSSSNSVSGVSQPTGNLQSYTLGTPVTGLLPAGATVTCSTTGNHDDADLYLRFGAEAVPNPNSSVNQCASFSSTSNESCTTNPAPADDTMFLSLIHI